MSLSMPPPMSVFDAAVPQAHVAARDMFALNIGANLVGADRNPDEFRLEPRRRPGRPTLPPELRRKKRQRPAKPKPAAPVPTRAPLDTLLLTHVGGHAVLDARIVYERYPWIANRYWNRYRGLPSDSVNQRMARAVVDPIYTSSFLESVQDGRVMFMKHDHPGMPRPKRRRVDLGASDGIKQEPLTMTSHESLMMSDETVPAISTPWDEVNLDQQWIEFLSDTDDDDGGGGGGGGGEDEDRNAQLDLPTFELETADMSGPAMFHSEFPPGEPDVHFMLL